MRTLKEFVDANIGESDLDIISRYLSQPEMLPYAPDMISTLLHKEINKLEIWKHYQEQWQSIPFSYLYDQYENDVAAKLDEMSRMMILGKPISENLERWAREVVPTLDCPNALWRDLYEWLHSKGIHFKKEPKQKGGN